MMLNVFMTLSYIILVDQKFWYKQLDTWLVLLIIINAVMCQTTLGCRLKY